MRHNWSLVDRSFILQVRRQKYIDCQRTWSKGKGKGHPRTGHENPEGK